MHKTTIESFYSLSYTINLKIDDLQTTNEAIISELNEAKELVDSLIENLLNEIQEVNLLVAKKDDCLMIALIFTFQNQVGKISLPIMNLTANQIR